MKKSLFLLLVFGLFNFYAEASEKAELKTSEATLTIDQKQNLKIILEKGEVIQVNSPLNRLWRIVLRNNLTRKEQEITPGKNVTIKKEGSTIRLAASGFLVENQSQPVKAEFTISVKEDAFCFSGSLNCSSKEWIIKEVAFPDISGIKAADNSIKIYWPSGLGQCFDSPKVFGSRSFDYPGNDGTMAWFTVNSPATGIYVGSHDPLQGAKKFSLSYEESNNSFNSAVNFPVYGSVYTVPDVMIRPYTGKWYVASQFYRGWYLKNFRIAKVSDWAQNAEGYMLTIFKQQNGEVMYNYKDVELLCDIAGKLNFSLVGIWGRGVGGHDRLYPNYMPDNLMGGRGELKKAIERAHQRGFKIIVYSNGTIMDTSTDYYKYNGSETILLNERRQPELEFYVKHDNFTPVIFALGCTGSALWRKTIMDLALDAQELGVDAFYIDEVAWREPLMCYSERHDHTTPQEAYTRYRVKMMHDIREKMKEKDPEFMIMTEGINDTMLPDVDLFQGVPGNVKAPYLFPEMFRYTFPEAIAITLNSDPGLNRYDANYSAVYGLRNQIMSRYPADTRYLQSGKIPENKDYQHVNNPPDIKKFTGTPAGEVTAYTHDLFQFEKENSGFFRSGKFIDEDGIVASGSDIVAKGFVSGDRLGVVVWNKHPAEKRDFSVSVPGYRLNRASEPENKEVNPSSPLDANSIRLLVYDKM